MVYDYIIKISFVDGEDGYDHEETIHSLRELIDEGISSNHPNWRIEDLTIYRNTDE